MFALMVALVLDPLGEDMFMPLALACPPTQLESTTHDPQIHPPPFLPTHPTWVNHKLMLLVTFHGILPCSLDGTFVQSVVGTVAYNNTKS